MTNLQIEYISYAENDVHSQQCVLSHVPSHVRVAS